MVPKKGTTLVEILVITAILVILVGILVPVLRTAQKQGLASDDITRLRQLGMARSMYSSESTFEVDRCEPLIEANLVNSSLCLSKSDFTKTGIGNEILSALAVESASYSKKVTPFPLTFLGSGDLFNEPILERIRTQPNPGWLVNLIHAEVDDQNLDTPWAWHGAYQRLLLDGSVQTKNLRQMTILSDGKTYTVSSPYLLFCEPDDKWLKEITTKS